MQKPVIGVNSMRTAVAAIAGLCALPFLAAGAFGQEEERYRLERTEEGYVRMDTQTGAMTLCREQAGELVCRPASESGEVGSSEIDALRDRVAELEERVKTLEQARDDVPLEQEFEQSLNMMERFFRRFVDIVRGLEQEEQTPQDQQSMTPERT